MIIHSINLNSPPKVQNTWCIIRQQGGTLRLAILRISIMYGGTSENSAATLGERVIFLIKYGVNIGEIYCKAHVTFLTV